MFTRYAPISSLPTSAIIIMMVISVALGVGLFRDIASSLEPVYADDEKETLTLPDRCTEWNLSSDTLRHSYDRLREAFLLPMDIAENGLLDIDVLNGVYDVLCAEEYSPLWGATLNAFELNYFMLQHEPDSEYLAGHESLLAVLLFLDDATQAALVEHLASLNIHLQGDYAVVRCIGETECVPAIDGDFELWEQYLDFEVDAEGLYAPFAVAGETPYTNREAVQAAYPQARTPSTKQNVIEISSIEELQRIGNDPDYPLSGHYVLTQDIDASDTANWNDGAGFDPIGPFVEAQPDLRAFSGSFDGQGHVIANLTIFRPEEDYIGLFGTVAQNASIQNIVLEHVSVTGHTLVGGLLGASSSRNVSQCYISGTVAGVYRVGGLMGESRAGWIAECHTTGEVTGESLYVGGLVGVNDGYWDTSMIINSYSECVVAGSGQIGGLVGNNYYGTISQSSASGEVTGEALVGGLVGFNSQGMITKSYAEGAVKGEWRVGGLAGWNHVVPLTECYATGNVTGNNEVGGLVGFNDGTLTRSFAVGDVSGNEDVGGLVGSNVNTLSQCFATGAVTGQRSVGGLLGYNGNTHWVSECYATGAVSGYDDVGGLVGWNSGTVSASYARSAVAGLRNVGGLVGTNYQVDPTAQNEGFISECYSSGLVTGNEHIGGLVGNTYLGNIVSSFWDKENSNLTTSAGGVGLLTSEMMHQSTFTDAGWDFESIWGINEGISYPYLLVFLDTGCLQVYLEPEEARLAGAQWRRVGDASWHDSGVTIPNIQIGAAAVEFRDVAYWETPSVQFVNILSGATNQITATYRMYSGSLQVFIQPAEAVTAGAQWRRIGDSNWRASGFTETDIPIGEHTVEFRDLEGWATPTPYSIAIVRNMTSQHHAVYSQDTGSLRVDLEPSEVRAAGAQWRRSGTGAWFDSGVIESEIPTGDYVVEFRDVENWETPLPEFVEVIRDVTNNITASYRMYAGSLQIFIEPAQAREAGAQWQREGTTIWFDSGEIESAIPVGEHTVTFRAIDDWDSPPPLNVPVLDSDIAQRTATYILQDDGTTEIPNVVGMTQANATTVLAEAGLLAGETTEAYHNEFSVGEVISQHPPPGTTLERGSSVALVISIGPEPIFILYGDINMDGVIDFEDVQALLEYIANGFAGVPVDSPIRIAADLTRSGSVTSDDLLMLLRYDYDGGMIQQVPQELRAESGGNLVTLFWRPVSHPNLYGYAIYRRAYPDGDFEKVGSTSNAQFDDLAVATGEYEYYVRTLDILGNEGANISQAVMVLANSLRIWIPEVWGMAGSEVCVPINLGNTRGIIPKTMFFQIEFDDDFLEFQHFERTTLSSEVAFSQNLSSGNLRLISVDQDASIIGGEGRFLDMIFTIKAASGSSNILLKAATILDSTDIPIEVLLSPGSVSVGENSMWGDLNQDGVVDETDLQILLDIAAQEITPTPYHYMVGDLNGDGRLDSADAVLLQRMIDGEPINPETKKEDNPDTLKLVSRALSMPDLVVQTGQRFILPVLLNNASNIAGSDIIFSWPEKDLVLRQVRPVGIFADHAYKVKSGAGFANLSFAGKGFNTKMGENIIGELEFEVIGQVTDNMNPAPAVRINFADLKEIYGESVLWFNDIALNSGEIVIIAAGEDEPDKIIVPSLIGMQQENAIETIESADLALGNIDEVHHAEIPADHVINQFPEAGSYVEPGTAIDLIISLGPESPDKSPTMCGAGARQSSGMAGALALLLGLMVMLLAHAHYRKNQTST